MSDGYSPAPDRVRRSFAGLGELALLFGAALAGSVRRPFYWQEFAEQCRTVLVANFAPILLTGAGLGFFVSIEVGQFFKAFSSLHRLGGFEVNAARSMRAHAARALAPVDSLGAILAFVGRGFAGIPRSLRPRCGHGGGSAVPAPVDHPSGGPLTYLRSRRLRGR